MNQFTASDHAKLASLFDPHAAYGGYKPNVKEIPNGDGKVDVGKRYLHIARKYNPPAWAVEYLARAHWMASIVAEALGVQKEYFPMTADGTLRVVEYPAGVGGEQHTDFDLFTVALYRSTPDDLIFDDACSDAEQAHAYRERLKHVHPGLHMGEIGELVGLGPATPHHVVARPYVQRSIVYFAMPDHAATFPGELDWYNDKAWAGRTVGEWLAARYKRSRT